MTPLRLIAAVLVLTVFANAANAQAPEPNKFAQLTEGKTKVSGLWDMYHKDQLLLVDIKDSMLSREYIVLPSIAKGISRGMVLGGMSWGDGEDVIWSFRKVDEKIFLVRRNVRYKAKKDSPEATAVELAYSDSILYALPILTKTPAGGVLIDMSQVFMNDNLRIGQELGGGFFFSQDRSTWAKVKAFEQNVEIQVAATYAGQQYIETVPDSRGVSVNVHYSISLLPTLGSNGFKTREADDRVGYFMTVIKDFSNEEDDQRFTRYITRWDLRKKDAAVKFSPPLKPIRFYLEKTVPVALRPTVKAGIMEWNKAFEKLGYAGAVEVLQQEDTDSWDPEDINYNTFRWITAEAGFAMGPSRVDPRTGQILDADIIFDASFLDSWKEDYETFGPQAVARLMPNFNPHDTAAHGGMPFTNQAGHGQHREHSKHCMLCQEMQWQMGFAAAALAGQGVAAEGGKLPEELVHQGLKEVVMHEVGHTLGLRHNFKASSWKTLDEINDLAKTQAEGTVSSVMDYSPVNIAPTGQPQPLYYSQTLGPYDYWAIEYGYANLTDEKAELAKIAAKSAQPALDYLTDEDTRGSVDSDPLSNRFDLGKDPLVFVKRQMQTSLDLLPKVVDRTVKDGQGYQRARQAFGVLFGEYWRALGFAARFPGGIYTSRDHKGTENARVPFRAVEPEKQREALKLVVEAGFSAPKLDSQSFNYLASTRWSHWGMNEPDRLDYPIHTTVERMQSMLLRQLFNVNALNRMVDNEYRTPEGQDAFTLAEHLQTVVTGVYSELSPEKLEGEFNNRKPFIVAFRRNLQRVCLDELTTLATSTGGGSFTINFHSGSMTQLPSAPQDARTLARMHLKQLDEKLTTLLASQTLKLDDYSKAHLGDLQAKVKAILEAKAVAR